MMPMASMPQQLTHINTDGMFIKVWGITKKKEMEYVRDVIDVYTKKFTDGFGILRSLSELIPGKLVLAYYDNQFHRAEVLRLSDTRKVIVNLIDVGVCTAIDYNEIRLADGIFSTISRTALAEEFILQGAIVKRPWSADESMTVNSLLSHCTEVVFTGIICDKKLVTIAINVNQALIGFSAFLANASLCETVTDEQLIGLIQKKYGSEIPTNPYHVPPPNIPNTRIPPLAIPQQTQIRPTLPAPFSHDVAAIPTPPPSITAPYHRIRTPKPPPTQAASQVQSYIYQNLPVGSTHEVCVSHVIDGMNAFTIQLKGVVESALPRLMARINDIRPIPFTDPIGPGTICLGRYTQDNSLCRAVVSNVLTDGANLYFVDFGNSEVVRFEEIYRIPTEFLQEPTMAVRFGLADVSSNYSLTTTEASAIFSDLVLRDDVIPTMKVTKSEVPSKQSCELFISCNGKLVNIKNKILDKVKLMKPVEYPRNSFKKNQVADVIISFAESPMRFYAQLEIGQSTLEHLMKCIQDYCLTSENKDLIYLEDVNENMAVCAQYGDGKWYRGLIIDEPDTEGHVTVFYVDFGNQDTVHFSQLRMMNNEMISQFPVQAIECRLNVDPSFTCTPEVSDMFVDMVDGQNFKLTIKNVLPGKVLLVDLVDAENISVADRLKEAFAVKPIVAPISPNAYSPPPKPQLQKSQSGNWRDKNAPTLNNNEGDYSSFRNREEGNQRPPRDPPNYRSEHDDRGGRGRNHDGRRRESDGVDTTDDAWNKKGGDFWGRDKGAGPRGGERQVSDSGEPWRKERYPKDDESGRRPPRNRYDQDESGQQNDRYQKRDQDDGGRKPYRRRDEDSNESKEGGGGGWSSDRRNSQENSWGGKPAGDKRFGGNRGRDSWDKKTSDDESHGGRPPRRENDFGAGWKGKREDGGFNENRGPRRDNRSNEGRSSDGWSNKREEKSNDTWNTQPSNQDDWGGGQAKDDSGAGHTKEDSWGNKRGDDSQSNRREGGFRNRDNNYSQNSYDRGPRKWEDRSAPVLEDGFEKGAQLVESDYQPAQEMDAVITWFVNPVRFYVMPADNSDFRTLMEDVQAEYPKRKPLEISEISTNDHVVARDKDKVIYRATVLRTSPRGVVVTFVDYGNTETVGKNQVWAIGPDHCAIPKQAICCSLYNVAPVDESGVWKESSEYDTYFSKDSFKLTFVQCVEEDNGKTWLVNLADPEGRDIADQLVADNLAVKKLVLNSEEPYDVSLLLHQTISAFLGAADSAKRFFVHIEPHKADHIRTCIETLTENPQALVPLPVENIAVGEFCLATSTDGAYYRAMILSENQTEKQAHVLFIDYGDECDVAFDVIMTLPDYLQIYNAQAVECCLFDSESFTNDDEFIKAIEEKDFVIKIMDVRDNKLHVKIFDVNGTCLPYPVESDETVPAICPLSIVRPTETVMISSMTQDMVYLQRVSDQNALNELNAKLFEKYETEGEQEKVAIESGKFYAAKSAQFEAWYRCQLTGPDNDKVMYIDYGNTEAIDALLAVKPLDEEFFSMPACSVGVRTSASVKSDSVETLLIAVQDNVFKGTFTNTGPGEWFVDLRTNDGKNFADCVVETDCGTKVAAEPERIYDAFENWQLQEEKKVKISATYSPTRFYVQLEEDAAKLSAIRDELELAVKLVLPMVGKSEDLCAAKSADDGKWYRCYQSDGVAVDYGFVINATSYKKLPFKFSTDKSKYVAECRLNVDAPGAEWQDEAVGRFKELVKQENEIVARLEFQRNPKIVELSSNGNSVAEQLVTEGLAKYHSYEVVISHVVSLSEFYVQEKESEDELFAMLERLTEAESWEPVSQLAQGDILAAKFVDDEQWYRAEVKSVSEDGIAVRFIDYGNESVCQEYRTLPDDLKTVPKFAVRCSVHPLPENADELTSKFSAFVDSHAEKPFSVYFLSRAEPMLVMLYFEDTIIEELLQDKPAPKIAFENVTVVHINSPSSFYVQTETPLLDTVVTELETVEGTEPVTNMEVNKLYAAKFVDDGLWYRAKAIGGDQVLFVDYGNTSNADDIRNLPESLNNIPYLAKHCAIPTPSGLEQWPEVATVRFSELTCDGNTVFVMNVIEENDPAFVELRDDGVMVMEELNTLCQAEKTAPTKEDDKPSVILSYIDSLNGIWIQEQKPAFDELTDELANVDGFDTLETADKDTVVAALFDEDGVWYRAKVVEKLEDGFQVHFVDFGNESSVTQIKSLPEDLAGMPAFAVRCRLAELPDESDEWTERMLAKLKEISETIITFSMVEKVEDNGVVRVTLHYEEGKNLADEVLKVKEESNDGATEIVNDAGPIPEDVPETQSLVQDSEPTESTASGVISDAKSVNEFHIQNDPDDVKEMQNSIQTSESTENAEPVVGDVVSALDAASNTWYRSEVDWVNDNKDSCNVTRIDFGGNFVTNRWTRLPEELAGAPAKALKCCLTLPVELKGKEADVTEKFLELVRGEESVFTYKIDGCENDVTNVHLFKDGVDVLDLLFPDRAKRNENVTCLSENSNDVRESGTIDVESESVEAAIGENLNEVETRAMDVESESVEIEVANEEDSCEAESKMDTCNAEYDISAENAPEECVTKDNRLEGSIEDEVAKQNDVELVENNETKLEEECVTKDNQLEENTEDEVPEQKEVDFFENSETEPVTFADSPQTPREFEFEENNEEPVYEIPSTVESEKVDDMEMPTESNAEVVEDTNTITKRDSVDETGNTDVVTEVDPVDEAEYTDIVTKPAFVLESENTVSLTEPDFVNETENTDAIAESVLVDIIENTVCLTEPDLVTEAKNTECQLHIEEHEPVVEEPKSVVETEEIDADITDEVDPEHLSEIDTFESIVADAVQTAIGAVVSETETVSDITQVTVPEGENNVEHKASEFEESNEANAENVEADFQEAEISVHSDAERVEADLPESEKSFADVKMSEINVVELNSEGISDTNDEQESLDVAPGEDEEIVSAPQETSPNDVAVTFDSEASNIGDTWKCENDVAITDISPSNDPAFPDSPQQETVDKIALVQNHRSETYPVSSSPNAIAEALNDSSSEKHSDASDTSKFCFSLNASRTESVYLSFDDEPEADAKRKSSNISSDSCSTFVAEVSSNASENDEKKSPLPKRERSSKKCASAEKCNTFKDHQFTVSYAENPGCFYVQKTVDAKRLNALEKQLQGIGESSAELQEVEIGSLVGAKIENCWVRAKVVDKDDFSGYMVFCIDYGTETKSKKLFKLPSKLKLLPPMVRRCGIPLPAHLSGWPQDVSMEFEEITQIENPTFKITPIQEGDDISYVNLTREGVDVWSRINELCQNYEDDGDIA